MMSTLEKNLDDITIEELEQRNSTYEHFYGNRHAQIC